MHIYIYIFYLNSNESSSLTYLLMTALCLWQLLSHLYLIWLDGFCVLEHNVVKKKLKRFINASFNLVENYTPRFCFI